jgi:hypothetical protein
MADTDIVNPNREILYIGDVAYKRANSEAIMSRFAATNNFISKYQVDYVSFFLNGSYSVTSGSFGFDGAYTAFTKSQIVGIQMWNAEAGSSGTTELDIRKLNTAGVDQGSIFSTTPKINSSASNAARVFRNYESGNDFNVTGGTLPVLNFNDNIDGVPAYVLQEGETIYLNVISTMISAKNCALTLNIRPIT